MNFRNTAIAALIFVALYNILFFGTLPGIGTALFLISLNIYFFFSRNPDNSNLNLAVTASVVGSLFAALFVFRSNGIVQLVDLLASVFFSLTSLYLYKYRGRISFYIPSFLLYPVLAIEKSVASIFSLFKGQNWTSEGGESQTTSSVVKGIIIAVPIFAVLFFLLTQADPIFSKLTQNFLTNIGERTIVSLILFMVLMGFGVAKFLEKTELPIHPSEGGKQAHSLLGKSHELSIILGSVVILFSFFILVQFRYLFAGVGEGELSQLGINSLTYSEYVRKGFFELLIASTIAILLIIYVFKYLHNLAGNQRSIVQIFSAVLTIETGLLLLSAVKRVFLYGDAHGLTRARVFGFIFLIWLAAILVVFLFRIFKEIKKEWFFTAVVSSTLCALLIVNLVNVDGLIATRYKPTVNKEIDYYYLANLSPDAVEAWEEAIIDSNRIITEVEAVTVIGTEENRKLNWTRMTLHQLKFKIEDLVNKYGTFNEVSNFYNYSPIEQGSSIEKLKLAKSEDEYPEHIKRQRKWQSLNLAEYNAYREIVDKMDNFSQINKLLNRIYNLDNKVTDDVRRNTPMDRSTEPPLLH